MQGEAPRERLLEEFRADGNAVLLGTASFWEGVDVKGEALRLVVIEKLPFASPEDPLVRARIEHLTANGGNAFRDYQLPEAALALKQGAGRLIRSEDDYGVVVICDPRMRGRGYGRVFLAALPPMSVTQDADEARRFLVAPCAAQARRDAGGGGDVKILALDTATENCSVALLIDGRLSSREERAGARTRRAHPAHDGRAAWREAGIALRGLDAIAFGRGPGAFTGVRLAASVTQGLAFGAGLPVVPVSDLRAVAQRAFDAAPGRTRTGVQRCPHAGGLLGVLRARRRRPRRARRARSG